LPSIEAVRAALANNLSTIPDVQVSPYMLGSPTPPSIHVQTGPAEYHQAMRDGAEWWEFRVFAFVSNNNDIAAQRRIDRMFASDGVESVKAALESDDTLGGLCDDLWVTGRSGMQAYAPEGRAPVWGAEWTVRVFI
jgi:hypothetical protein